jgi:hypothetical protein
MRLVYYTCFLVKRLYQVLVAGSMGFLAGNILCTGSGTRIFAGSLYS